MQGRLNGRHFSVKESDHGTSPSRWHGRGPATCSSEECSGTEAIGAKALVSDSAWTIQRAAGVVGVEPLSGGQSGQNQGGK